MQKVSFLDKIRNIQSFPDLIKKIRGKMNFMRNNLSFIINDKLVSLFHGKDVENYFVFRTSPDDVDRIRGLLESSRQLKFSNNKSTDTPAIIARKSIQFDPSDKEVYEAMSADSTWFEMKKNVFFDNFFKKIAPTLKNYLKSPFAIVNLRGWKTKPNMQVVYDNENKPRGPNRPHSDGFPPGHFKCMIYLNPLNISCGKFQIKEKIFESEKPGLSLIFKNSNLIHQSIPGESENRYVLELTLMRTVVNVDMLKYYPSTPDSLHLQQAYYAYF